MAARGRTRRGQTSLMREQLDDGRYEKIRKKMMEPEYEFHLEPDVQTVG